MLNGISLHLPYGYNMCLMGPSGCGKTTLIRVLMGLEKADKGSIEGIGNQRIGAVFQEDRLLENFTPEENIRIVLEKEKDRSEILRHLGCVFPNEIPKKPVRCLSGGMRRRVALVRAVMAPAEILILDEPFTGLDEETKRLTMDYLEEERRGRTLLFSSHQKSDATYLKAKIYRMEMGKF